MSNNKPSDQPDNTFQKRSYTSIRHKLSEIDAENMTAICSVCGRTDIYRRPVKGITYYVCATRGREYDRQASGSWDPNRIIHSLSQVDEKNKTAVCSRCGPAKIYLYKLPGTDKTNRRCHNALIEDLRQGRVKRRESNTKLINQFKTDHGCDQCGYNEDPLQLNIYSQDKTKKELKFKGLRSLRRKQLIQKLESCEVLCVNCHSPQPKHHLENIDLEQRTAICSTCGSTEIVTIGTHKHGKQSPMIYCRVKWQEINRDAIRRYRAKKRSQDPNWKPKHTLSEIDPKIMRGVCALCGPTDILKATSYHNLTFYRCATRIREQARDYSRSHYQPVAKS